MKIAVVGAGISGLTAAYLLAKYKEGAEVTLFEKRERLGGHTNTIKVERDHGSYNVDTGFIVHNDRNYPNFTKLMQELKIPTEDSSMSFSVKVEENGLEYNGTTINTLFCQRKNILNFKFLRMIRDILRFNEMATKHFVENTLDSSLTLEKFLDQHQFSREFREYYIIPMGAAIWSASREEMRFFPLNFFVRFFHHHGMLTVDDRPTWRVLTGGSFQYLGPITEILKSEPHQIKLGCQIQKITRADKVTIQTTQEELVFDHVIMACHGDQARELLDNTFKKERDLLSHFHYRPNDVLLHTDESVLPKKKLGHAAWNYYLPTKERERVAVTYHMNILQNIKAPENFLVSLNMDDMIDPKKVIKAIPYSHPVYNLEAVKAQNRWSEVSNFENKIHFVGAYWANGFHEDGVKTAVRAIQELGVNWGQA